MNRSALILKSLWHFRRPALTVVLGMAIGVAVITGALVTGDSVKSGLQKLVSIRLGNIDLAISADDRYFTDSLAGRMASNLNVPSAAVLQLQGSATSGGGSVRLPKVQVFGVDQSFCTALGDGTFSLPDNPDEAVISDNLAAHLNVVAGDEILIRINKPGPIPIDAPFVSDAGNILSIRITIKAIAGKGQHGRYHLQNTQSAPFNVFMNRSHLQKLAGLEGLSNRIVMAGNGKVTPESAGRSLEYNRTLADAGLHLEKQPDTGECILRTPRIFFDLPTLNAIEGVPSGKSLWFSYFVNEFKSGSRTAPYSFVSTLPGDIIKPGEILINQWLADDLKAKPGDSVKITYFMVGPLRQLNTEKTGFKIAGIIPMDDPRCDRRLMPEIPGLSDAGNCRDWETSIPVDLDKIRDKDEDYWNRYRGTPKAFINALQAADLWQNRFGKYTQVRFSPDANADTISKAILSNLHPSETGITIRNPAIEGMTAASSGVDFSGLFLGLSIFLIAGGIILTILLIRLGIDGRRGQIGTLRALGWPGQKIRQLLLTENILVAVAGTIAGTFLTFLYTILIFSALNGVWNSIVLTDTLRPVFRPMTMLMGIAAGLMVSAGAAWIAISRYFRQKPVELQRKSRQKRTGRKQFYLTIPAAICGATSITMLGYGLVRFQSISPTFFFSAGSVMLISLILLAVKILQTTGTSSTNTFSINVLSRSNIRRNSNRSLSVILLFSIGIFMVIAIGANRQTVDIKDGNNGGTGGFQLYMETTVPVPDNLNDPAARSKYGLESTSAFVQMKRLEGDDASCLNLNRVSNPPLLGVPNGAFTGRFTFSSSRTKNEKSDPWKVLDSLPDGLIPAVADMTVIQWGLGKKIGDTLKYKSELGDTVKVVLVGGLTNSIFQGNLLIPEALFIRYWPSVNGTNVFLISAGPNEIEKVKSEIGTIFRDYGTDMKPASEKLAEFNSVENTYLSIFLVMGALAMLLGTVGLAVILARNLQERRSEIAVLRAAGFSKNRILSLIIGEYSTLLLVGTMAGGIPALVSVLPGLLNPAGEVSPLFLLSILAILLLNGLAWIVVLGRAAVRGKGIVQSLRNE